MRKNLSLLSIFLLLLIVYYGCQEDDLAPGYHEEVVCPDFSVKDAKAWFEANTEVLRGLNFNENKELETRGGVRRFPVLTPWWEKGVAQSNQYLRVIEIPLLSDMIVLARRRYVLAEGSEIKESCIAQRKLVVMRRPNGYTRTFVMTLIPDLSYQGRLGDFINKFRYLGENDFSGYVMFSDPDGTFVEGYHYWGGRREYVLSVKPISEAKDVIESGDPYTVLRMAEGGEGEDNPGYDPKENQNNMICDFCNGEGCPKCANPDCPYCFGSGCVHCKDVALGEVIITPDPQPDPEPPIIINPFPDVPLPTGCPICGLITCNGDCESYGDGGNYPPHDECLGERCPDCGGIIPEIVPFTRSIDCPICRCPVKVSIDCSHTVDILNPYPIKIKVKPTATLVSRYMLEIARENSDVWMPLYSGVLSSFTRFSMSSGYWKVRAKVMYQNTLYVSDPENIEERFPRYEIILNNPTVKKTFDEYWKRTKDYATDHKAEKKRKEFGCWVYLNTGNGEYSFKEVSGEEIIGGVGTHGTINAGNRPEDVTSGPLESCVDCVAFFHTHTPLTYMSGEGRREPVGPSDGDWRWAREQKIVGFAYDYLPYGIGEGIEIGHPIDIAAKVYHFGPNRRFTKKN